MTTAARQLLDLLDIEQLEVDLFRGTGAGGETSMRIFGGHVIAQALMAVLNEITLGGTPADFMATMSDTARSHSPPRAQAEMQLLKEMVSGWHPAEGMVTRSLSACSHLPHRAHADIAELKVTVFAATLASRISSFSNDRARSHFPALPQAEMRELKVTVVGATPAACISSSNDSACCHCPVFSYEAIAADQLYTSGSMPEVCMSRRSFMADSVSRARLYALIPRLYSHTFRGGCSVRISAIWPLLRAFASRLLTSFWATESAHRRAAKSLGCEQLACWTMIGQRRAAKDK